ncbi:MAG: GNAT family N-acetyltransferase [Bdellovibrionales bacterium]|nr:GNAT family N-acetyltransferase [Bdellovibrionales bacterium]
MNHNIYKSAFGIRLRPALVEDSEMILELRSNPSLTEHMGSFEVSLDQQIEWMKSYLARPDEYYFIIESGDMPVGTLGIYNTKKMDDGSTEAEWGRWILRREYAVGPISAYLLLGTAFDDLGVETLFCQTTQGNHSVIAFHDMFAHRAEGRESTVYRDAKKQEVIFHEYSKSDWAKTRKQLEGLARITAARSALERSL